MRKSILIVDDEPLTRMDLAQLVRDEGFEAWEAANTSEALAVLQAAPDTFAFVLTDLDMPGTRSGAVLTNHIACLWPHIRVVIISGGHKPLPGEVPHGTAFVAKPFSRPTVSAAMTGAASG